MKILVCIKQVPQKDAPLKLNDAGTWIREDVSYEVNEPDAYALEEALRQKEKHGGEVVVVTAGPSRAQQVLREALAKGADRAIHLEDDRFATLDAANIARALAAEPEVLMADELSLGLAPILARHLLDKARAAADRGAGVLIVEQHISQALRIADRVYVMQRGRIALEGTAAEITDRLGEIESAYLTSLQ